MNASRTIHFTACVLFLAGLVFLSAGTAQAQQKSNAVTDDDWDILSNPPHMYSIPTGNVGIGASSPNNLLHVGMGDESAIQLGQGPAMLLERFVVDNKFQISLGGGGYLGNILQIGRDNQGHDIALMGDVGIGTTNPDCLLHVGSGDESIIQLGDGPQLRIERSVVENRFRIQLTGGGYLGNVLQLGRDNMGHDIALMGDVGVGTTAPMSLFHVDGRTTTKSIEILGGADLSEQFDIRSENNDSTPAPGMVVCIDAENPGKLIVSSKAYDRTVAGIISGAGGVNTGMLMGQRGSEAHGETPVALTGRVYCHATASNGAIEPGDLLTTSDKPGFAMKVSDHGMAQGAILGKAMSTLEEGEGLVLVLVTLQ